MPEKGIKSQVVGGLRLAALTLAGLGVAGLFFGGVAYAFFPTGHSRILGWVFLIISTPVMIVEMNRWVKALPGILGLAVLNGVLMLSTGHALGSRFVPISRLDVLGITLFFAASAVLSQAFKGRELNLVDRIALLAFVSSIASRMGFTARIPATGGVASAPSKDPLTFIALGIGLCCLLVAWAYDRWVSRPLRRARGGLCMAENGAASRQELSGRTTRGGRART
jgi:hypothetical protein